MIDKLQRETPNALSSALVEGMSAIGYQLSLSKNALGVNSWCEPGDLCDELCDNKTTPNEPASILKLQVSAAHTKT